MSRSTLGLLVPPQIPEEVAEKLADDLRDLLPAHGEGTEEWELTFARDERVPDAEGDRRPAHPDARHDSEELDAVQDFKQEQGWDAAVCVTDLPLRAGSRALVGEARRQDRVALVSLPALGPVRWRRRARTALRTLLRDVLECAEGDSDRVLLRSPPVWGHVRVVTGMVRANRPWRIVLRLSFMLAGALATGAFALVTSDIWMLSDTLGALRLAILSVVSIASMVLWLIFVHDLWERPSGSGALEQAALFNAVTTVSLTLGVVCLYAALFVLTLAGGTFIVEASVFESTLKHPVDLGSYLTLAWMTSSMATVGGALGSGLESDIDIREAAYSYHPERHEGES